MSELSERMEIVDAARGVPYYRGLLEISGGGIVSAAAADLAIDGRLVHVDLRRAPFAGDEDLKRLYRAAREAQADLAGHLLMRAWAAGRNQ